MPLPIQDAAALAATVHAGELAGEAMGGISVLAGMLGRIAMPFVSDDEKRQRLIVMTVSAVALALYCREADVKVIGHGFTIMTSFCVVALATLGMFNLSDPKNYTKENMKSFAHSASLGIVKKPTPPDPDPPTPPSV